MGMSSSFMSPLCLLLFSGCRLSPHPSLIVLLCLSPPTRHRFLLYEPSYLDARDFAAVFSRPGEQPGLRKYRRPGEQEASLIRDFDAPSQVDQAQQLTGPSSSSSSSSSSLLQLPALLQPSAYSCSFQHSCSFQLTPAASSSLLQLPAASSSSLRRSTDVPLPIPAPADDLIQCPLTSSARYRPDTVPEQTTSVVLPSTVRK
ncbi:unnamed protein product [Acanthosepion pharaonis]|uniref:Uncharacterized protein n=1 Tax=Acanthosepion pharaonis TaxID=158019 RepID=A0A812D4X1_ACAPH|nr:unnamed protein product [Sepia pharaonis]